MRVKALSMAVILALALPAALGACADRGPGESVGTVVGGVLGAVVGSQIGSGTGQIVATAAGTLLGAWIGGSIGRSLDERDRETAYKTDQKALEANADGEKSSWSNPDNKTSGAITPVNNFQSAGRECRDYEKSVVVDGEVEQAKGTACRASDGTWVEAN